MQQFAYATGKNAIDSAMVIDIHGPVVLGSFTGSSLIGRRPVAGVNCFAGSPRWLLAARARLRRGRWRSTRPGSTTSSSAWLSGGGFVSIWPGCWRRGSGTRRSRAWQGPSRWPPRSRSAGRKWLFLPGGGRRLRLLRQRRLVFRTARGRPGLRGRAQAAPRYLGSGRPAAHPLEAARALTCRDARHPGDWTPVGRHFCEGHSETWCAADARLGGYRGWARLEAGRTRPVRGFPLRHVRPAQGCR